MARLAVEGDELVLHLSWLEKLAGFRGDIRGARELGARGAATRR